MDEIEYKLKTGNSVLVVNAVEKLINTIKSNFKPAERARFVLTNEELQYLKEKCLSKDTVVSLTACQGLLALVESGVLEIAHTMSMVITLLPSAHNYSAIISTMAGLLVLDLKSRLVPGQTYKCQFSFQSPQHPFITVLDRNEAATQDVLNQMHALCTHPDYVVQSNSLELLRPVFLWMTCRPEGSRSAAWPLLLSLQESSGQEELLLECLCWLQSNNPKQVDSVLAAYKQVTEAAIYQGQTDLVVAMIPLLTRLSNLLILHGRDPRPCYSIISRCFTLEAEELRLILGLTVALLADNLTVSCGAHLYELFHLCLTITTKHECPLLSQSIFVAQTLQWLHLPSSLTNQALRVGSKIVDNYQNSTKEDNRLIMPNLYKNKIFQKLLSTDERISVYFKVLKTFERVKDDPDQLRSWFESIDSTDMIFKLDLVGFLSGVTLLNKDGHYEDVCLKAIEMLVAAVDEKKDNSIALLPILVYKVGHDDSPMVKVECLKAVPLMAKTKENVPTILSILNKLKTSKEIPTSFLLELFKTLSRIQPRCSAFLQEMLVCADGREAKMAAAAAVKETCEIRPSFGVTLVPIISSILNQCTDSESAGACNLALGALGALWKAGAVSPVATWKALEPKLGKDRRKLVQIGICELLSEVPDLYISTPEYDELLHRAATKLWHYLSESHEPAVCGAAADALSRFEITQYTLKCVPEIYTRTVRLPPAFCKTPIDAARKPEDVLDYIPCEIWPEVFANTNQDALQSISKLVSTLISREIKSFRSGVYQPKSGGEPQTMSYLPAHSVLRGVTDAVRNLALSRSHAQPSVILSLFSSLTADHPRPLPPLDLAFLLDLYHSANIYKHPCILMAVKQAQTSGSAKRMVETFLGGVDPEKMEESEIISLFEILPHLCRNVAPNTIRGLIEKCLRHAFDIISQTTKKVDNEEYLFVKLLGFVKECLENDKIHDANRTLLAQIVESYWQVIGEDNVSWKPFIQCCTALPTKNLELMSSPSSWWEVTPTLLRKSAALRSSLALHHLHWLPELIDAAAACPTEQEYTLQCISEVLRKSKADEAARDWLMQLLARIQAAFVESEDETSRSYLFSVFALSVTSLSGHWCLEYEPQFDRMLEPVPAAAAALFRREGWTEYAHKLCDWLSHSSLSRGASATCARTLQAMRHAPGFPVHAMWSILRR